MESKATAARDHGRRFTAANGDVVTLIEGPTMASPGFVTVFNHSRHATMVLSVAEAYGESREC